MEIIKDNHLNKIISTIESISAKFYKHEKRKMNDQLLIMMMQHRIWWAWTDRQVLIWFNREEKFILKLGTHQGLVLCKNTCIVLQAPSVYLAFSSHLRSKSHIFYQHNLVTQKFRIRKIFKHLPQKWEKEVDCRENCKEPSEPKGSLYLVRHHMVLEKKNWMEVCEIKKIKFLSIPESQIEHYHPNWTHNSSFLQKMTKVGGQMSFLKPAME